MIENKKRLAELLLLVVAAGWGIGFPVMKLAINEYSVLVVLALRFTLSSLLLFPFSINKLLRASYKSIILGVFLGGLLGISFMFLMFGLQLTTAANTGFLAGLSVIWVLILSTMMSSKTPTYDIYISSILGIIGLYLMSEINGWKIQTGDSLVIIGSIFTAIHIITLDKVGEKYDSMVLTFLQVTTISIIIICILKIQGQNFIPHLISMNLVYTVLITSIFSTVISFWIQTKYQHHTTPNRAVLIYNLEPLFSAIFAVWLLQERISLNVVIGGGLILLGMYFPNFIFFIKKNFKAL